MNFQFSEFEPVEFKRFSPLKLEPNMSPEQIELRITEYLQELDTLIPSINEDFNPEEDLKKIKKNDKESRKQAIEKFKKNLRSQIEGMSCCKMIIQELIDIDPNVKQSVLELIVKKFSSVYGINPAQLKKYLDLINDFCTNRESVIEIRKKYPNDFDLINQIKDIKRFSNFGIFKSKIKIETTPYGFIFYMNERDALKINPNAGSTEGFAGALMIDGKYFFYSVVILEPYKIFKRKLTNDDIRRHEFQHQKECNFEFGMYFFRFADSETHKNSYKEKLAQNLLNEFMKNPTFNKIVKKFFPGNQVREFKFEDEEILQDFEMFCQNVLIEDFNKITGELISRKKDLAKDNIDEITNDYSSINEVTRLMWIVIYNKYFSNSLKEKIKLIKEKYEKLLKKEVMNASNSFDRLTNEGGYSIDEAIALVSYTPLELWTKKIDRILKNRKLSN